MKKILPVVSIFAILLVATPVLAAKNQVGAQDPTGSQQQSGVQEQQQIKLQLQVSPSPVGSQIKNQNQVKTQNAGDDSNLMVGTEEQENLKTGSSRNGQAIDNMSNVATKVEELLSTKGLQGGIGQQVRVIAQEQKMEQEKIQSELGNINSRGGILKSIIGPDFKALKNIQKQMEQNQMRIQALTQLQNELTNQGDITEVKEMIQVLEDQNTMLQDKISLEEKTSSLLGWLVRLFVN